MATIGLFSGILLFSVLCLLPEVKADETWYAVVTGQGDDKSGIKSRGSPCLLSRHNADKYGY